MGIVVLLVLFCLAAACAASASGPVITAEPALEYDTAFRNARGWIGADGDYSVPLGKDRVIWLFSDTFVGRVEDGKRVDCTMINNSVAVQSLSAPGKVEFFYRQDKDGKPASVFTPEDGRGYFWLFAGAMTPGGLFIFMPQVESTGGGAFGFRTIGMSLGHVPNPHDPPAKWTFTQRLFPYCRYEGDETICFGSATLADGDYVYIYGSSSRRDDQDKRISSAVVARAPVADLDNFSSWRFYSKREWTSDWQRCEALYDGATSECSVSYLPSVGQFAAVYTSFGISGMIVMRLAPRPEGPWGEPVKLYDCPDKDWHEHAFSYAAKAHPELSKSPDELIISYATNSSDFADLITDARLYWPRFVRVKIR